MNKTPAPTTASEQVEGLLAQLADLEVGGALVPGGLLPTGSLPNSLAPQLALQKQNVDISDCLAPFRPPSFGDLGHFGWIGLSAPCVRSQHCLGLVFGKGQHLFEQPSPDPHRNGHKENDVKTLVT